MRRFRTILSFAVARVSYGRTGEERLDPNRLSQMVWTLKNEDHYSNWPASFASGAFVGAITNEPGVPEPHVTIRFDPNDRASMMDAIVRSNGLTHAEQDFSNAYFRVCSWGIAPMGYSKWADDLSAKYGVYVTDIAGCLIDPELGRRATEYNSRMKGLLNRKYGKDIFAAATEAVNTETGVQQK